MYASFVSELDNSTNEKNKIESIRKLIDFHMDIKECVSNKIIFLIKRSN